MKKNKPLVIYDCDGTLQGLLGFVYADARRSGKTNLSLAEFKKQKGASTADMALFPGMNELVQYTNSIGNNVLLSGGDPVNSGCKDLQNMLNLFQDWQFEGNNVPKGKIPDLLKKNDYRVAKSLKNYFLPNDLIIVIGDSTEEAELAGLLHGVFIKRGYSLSEKEKNIPGLKAAYACQTADEIKDRIQTIMKENQALKKHIYNKFAKQTK